MQLDVFMLGFWYLQGENDISYCFDKVNLVNKYMINLFDSLDREYECRIYGEQYIIRYEIEEVNCFFLRRKEFICIFIYYCV